MVVVLGVGSGGEGEAIPEAIAAAAVESLGPALADPGHLSRARRSEAPPPATNAVYAVCNSTLCLRFRL